MKKTCSLVTLGCKANQYDTQAIREGLVASGYVDSGPGAGADLYLVNTCTVTAQSGAKSRKEIRRIVRENPGAQVVVTGCYAESDRLALEQIEGVTFISGNAEKFQIPNRVTNEPWDVADTIGAISRFDGHTRAFMKVEDGCDVGCTYCIIPAVRGPVRSKPIAAAVAEAHRLVAAGHKEIVLTGIHLGAYGTDRRGEDLAGLVAALDEVDGLARVRISSIEVNEVDDRLLAVMAASPKACPHFHLPLQSGDDQVLKRMARPYSVKMFRDSVERIGSALPSPTVTTDLIVGFPGETEEQFEQTLALCRAIGFIKIHVFPYSRREGTPAARMTERLTDKGMADRVQRALALSDELGLAHRRSRIGATVELLLEGDAGGGDSSPLSGMTTRYERVVVDNATTGMVNQIQTVRIDRAEPTLLFGRLACNVRVG